MFALWHGPCLLSLIIAALLSADVWASSVPYRNRSMTGTASNGVAPYQNATWTGDCWKQWSAYWTKSQSTSTILKSSVLTTETHVYQLTYYSTEIDSIPTKTLTTTVTDYDPVGSFPMATQTYTLTLGAGGIEFSESPTSTGASFTSRVTQWAVTYVTKSLPFATPACTLPPVVPQCQSQWDGWVNAGAAQNSLGLDFPACQAASLNSAQCSTVISEEYADIRVFGNTGIPGWVTNGTSTWWPSTRSFAPSCTLGCQTCAITGDTVQVYYWPAPTASLVENGTGIAKASHFMGNKSVPVTAVVGNATLTSPTIYISYKTLHASNSCSGVGKRYSNTIIPLAKTADLKSLAYHELDALPLGPGMSGMGVSWEYEEKPFNLTDLTEPIPESIYNQQPWCQESLSALSRNGMDTTSFTCTPHRAYAPIIAIPSEVGNIDPEWASCTGWYGGLFDPPKALQGVSAEATPTVPTVTQQTSASAGSTAKPSQPKQTTVAGQTSEGGSSDPTETAASPPNNDPANTQPATGVSDPSNNGAGSADNDPTTSLDAGQGNAAPAQTTSADQPAAPTPDPATSTNAANIASAIISAINSGAGTTMTNTPAGSDLASTHAAQPAASSARNDPAAQPLASSADPNAVSVLSAALDPTTTPVNDPAATTAPVAQSPAPEGETAQSQGGQTLLTVNVPDPSGANTGAAGQPQQSTVVLTQGESTVVPGLGTVVAGSNNAVVAGTTVAFSNAGGSAVPPKTPSAVFTAGGQTFTAAQPSGSSGALVIAGASSELTVAAGGSAVIEGQTISAQSTGGLVVGSQTVAFASPSQPEDGSATAAGGSGAADTPSTPIVVGGQTFTAHSQSNGLVLEGQSTSLTLAAGGAAATLGSDAVSAGSSGGVAVNGNTVQVVPTPGSSNAAAEQQGTTVAVPSGGEAVMIGGQTFTAKSQGGGGLQLVGASTTVDVSPNGPAQTIGGAVISATSSGQLAIESQPAAVQQQGTTLNVGAGGELVTVGGQTFTAHSSADGIELEGASTTIALQSGQAQTVGSAVVSAAGSGQLAIESQPAAVQQGTTLNVGAGGEVVTIGGHTFTAQSSGGSIELDGASTTISLSAGSQAQTIEGAIVSAVGNSQLAVEAQTAAQQGTTMSIGAAGQVVTINGQTFMAESTNGGIKLEGASTTIQLSANGPAQTIGSEIVSAASSGELAINPEQTASLPSLVQAGQPFTLGTAVLTASPVAGGSGDVVAAGQTLSAGGPAKTIDGSTVSEGRSGLVVGGKATGSSSGLSLPSITTAPEASGTQDGAAVSSTSSAGAGSVKLNELLVGIPMLVLGFFWI